MKCGPGRGRGRGSYQTEAPKGRFGGRSLGRGSNQDSGEYNRLRGNDFYQRGSRWDLKRKKTRAIEYLLTGETIRGWSSNLVFGCGSYLKAFWAHLEIKHFPFSGSRKYVLHFRCAILHTWMGFVRNLFVLFLVWVVATLFLPPMNEFYHAIQVGFFCYACFCILLFLSPMFSWKPVASLMGDDRFLSHYVILSRSENSCFCIHLFQWFLLQCSLALSSSSLYNRIQLKEKKKI